MLFPTSYVLYRTNKRYIDDQNHVINTQHQKHTQLNWKRKYRAIIQSLIELMKTLSEMLLTDSVH